MSDKIKFTENENFISIPAKDELSIFATKETYFEDEKVKEKISVKVRDHTGKVHILYTSKK